MKRFEAIHPGVIKWQSWKELTRQQQTIWICCLLVATQDMVAQSKKRATKRSESKLP